MNESLIYELVPEDRLIAVMAHVLLMGRGTYETPEEWAKGMLRRFAHEGFRVVQETPHG